MQTHSTFATADVLLHSCVNHEVGLSCANHELSPSCVNHELGLSVYGVPGGVVWMGHVSSPPNLGRADVSDS